MEIILDRKNASPACDKFSGAGEPFGFSASGF